MFFKIVIGIMSALLIIGEIGIIIASRISKKAKAEISEKQYQDMKILVGSRSLQEECLGTERMIVI